MSTLSLTEHVVRQKIIDYGPVCRQIMFAALDRTVVKDYKSMSFDGVTLECDFTKPGNLIKADEVLLPYINGLLVDAEKLGVTAVTQLFGSKQVQYALKNGVALHSFMEITKIVFPHSVEEEREPTKILDMADFLARRAGAGHEPK